ncbi:MAG: stage II sporulation protein R [Bacillota bacterium]
MLRFHPVIAVIVLVALLFGFHQYQVRRNPCYEVLRLHVVANSDSPYDQAVKLKVRDAILNLMEPRFYGVDNASAACRIATSSLPDIEQTARDILTAYGQDIPVEASVGTFSFPTRFYGTQVFPPGEYTAVRVVLGEGKGQNWWCVLFPPLCLNNLEQSGSELSKGLEVKLKIVEVLKEKPWLNKMAGGQ